MYYKHCYRRKVNQNPDTNPQHTHSTKERETQVKYTGILVINSYME